MKKKIKIKIKKNKLKINGIIDSSSGICEHLPKLVGGLKSIKSLGVYLLIVKGNYNRTKRSREPCFKHKKTGIPFAWNVKPRTFDNKFEDYVAIIKDSRSLHGS